MWVSMPFASGVRRAPAFHPVAPMRVRAGSRNDAIAGQFGVSRGVARECVRGLEERGLVRRRTDDPSEEEEHGLGGGGELRRLEEQQP